MLGKCVLRLGKSQGIWYLVREIWSFCLKSGKSQGSWILGWHKISCWFIYTWNPASSTRNAVTVDRCWDSRGTLSQVQPNATYRNKSKTICNRPSAIFPDFLYLLLNISVISFLLFLVRDILILALSHIASDYADDRCTWLFTQSMIQAMSVLRLQNFQLHTASLCFDFSAIVSNYTNKFYFSFSNFVKLLASNLDTILSSLIRNKPWYRRKRVQKAGTTIE